MCLVLGPANRRQESGVSPTLVWVPLIEKLLLRGRANTLSCSKQTGMIMESSHD